MRHLTCGLVVAALLGSGCVSKARHDRTVRTLARVEQTQRQTAARLGQCKKRGRSHDTKLVKLSRVIAVLGKKLGQQQAATRKRVQKLNAAMSLQTKMVKDLREKLRKANSLLALQRKVFSLSASARRRLRCKSDADCALVCKKRRQCCNPCWCTDLVTSRQARVIYKRFLAWYKRNCGRRACPRRRCRRNPYRARCVLRTCVKETVRPHHALEALFE